MKSRWTLHVCGILGAIVLSASVVGAVAPLIITNLSGRVHIHQPVPCGDPVDRNTAITGGLMEMTPQITRGGMLFDLTRLEVFLRPFSVQRECRGIRATADFREIGIRLVSAVRFVGEETGGLESRLFRFTIPKEQFRIYESVLDNARAPQPETKFRRPSEDVTGLIDLIHQTVQLHVVITNELHFRAGCVKDHCRIDEMLTGTQTANVLAVVTRGPTPPTVACMPVDRPGSRFRVAADDDSVTLPIVRFGSYMLTIGEVIQLTPSREPGVRLLASTNGGIRHFQVGPGDNFIVATDSDGLSAIAFCQ